MLLCALALSVALAGCAGDGDDAMEHLIDELGGSYRGVGIGSTEADVRTVFGQPSDSEAFRPTAHDDVRGPYAVPIPGSGPSAVMAYDDEVFMLASGRVFAFLAAADAETLRGIAIGDPIDDVREAYPTVACREAHAGEAILGSEDPTYTLCRVELTRDRILTFEEDPVRSITLLDPDGM